MNADEITELIPQLLEARYPGRYQRVGFGEVPGGMQDPGGWALDLEDAFCFVRASRASNPFIWLKVGVALAIPPSPQLAHYVATANRDLMVGRAYLAAGEEVAMVVLDETILAHAISLDYEPSIQDLVNRVEAAIGHARKLRGDVLSEFGGRPFVLDDWHLLML